MITVGTHNENFRVGWLEKTLQRIPAGSRILDAGAGEQQFKKFCSHMNYIAQDFGQYDGKGDGAGLQMGVWDQENLDLICDICAIPEPDESFDAIMCVEVIEHLSDPIAAIKEFSRLLGKGGYLILTAPFSSLTHFAPYHYTSGFNSYFYTKHLKDSGFDSIEICANGNFFEVVAQELRRIDYVVNEFIDKKNSYCRLSRLERLCLKNVLKMLERFSKNDTGSSHLLCHGYNILCRKV